jgi:hypothetical protein
LLSDATNQATAREWRELGFFYERDDDAKTWKLIGSRSGLFKFRDALLAYAADSRNAQKSEHEHYGPYMYLKIMTWPEAGFEEHEIRGTLVDLERLAAMVDARLTSSKPGDTIRIQNEFAPNSLYALVLEVRGDGFDPAEADTMLPKGIP